MQEIWRFNPDSGRSPGGGNVFQYSCLESLLDKGACGLMVHGVLSGTQR